MSMPRVCFFVSAPLRDKKENFFFESEFFENVEHENCFMSTVHFCLGKGISRKRFLIFDPTPVSCYTGNVQCKDAH